MTTSLYIKPPQPITRTDSEGGSSIQETVLGSGSDAGWALRILDCENVGFDYLRAGYRAGSGCSPTCLLYWMLEGQATLDYGDGPRPFKAGELAICLARRPHWLALKKGRARGVWIHLTDGARWHFLQSIKSTIRPAREIRMVELILTQCLAEGNSRKFGAYENAVHYAEILGVLLMRELSVGDGQRDLLLREKLAQLQREVDSSLHLKWTVDLMAEKIRVSPSYLYQLCQRHLGARPLEFVARLRMDRARTKLLHTDTGLDQIAAEVGYQSAYAFSAAFLRHVGQRPGEVRRAARLGAKTPDP